MPVPSTSPSVKFRRTLLFGSQFWAVALALCGISGCGSENSTQEDAAMASTDGNTTASASGSAGASAGSVVAVSGSGGTTSSGVGPVDDIASSSGGSGVAVGSGGAGESSSGGAAPGGSGAVGLAALGGAVGVAGALGAAGSDSASLGGQSAGGQSAGGQSAGGQSNGGAGNDSMSAGGSPAGGSAGDSSLGEAGASTGGASGTGPLVDRSDPQLHQLQFTALTADASASIALGNQYAYLDTRVEPTGKLVVYLHGAGSFSNCGNLPLATLVAGWGFHWFAPCFSSDYGVDNCGDDIAGCRLEAFEGEDHHAFINIARPDSIEERVVRGLNYLQEQLPEGDWQYFLDGEAPRWSEIIITGHSHGASTSGIIGMNRNVARVVMLAGPYDPGQAWLSQTPITPPERFYGFTHSGDSQHQGHLDALDALGLPGVPTLVDSNDPPYANTHRLYTSAGVSDAHGSVTGGDIEAFVPVWRYLYAE